MFFCAVLRRWKCIASRYKECITLDGLYTAAHLCSDGAPTTRLVKPRASAVSVSPSQQRPHLPPPNRLATELETVPTHFGKTLLVLHTILKLTVQFSVARQQVFHLMSRFSPKSRRYSLATNLRGTLRGMASQYIITTRRRKNPPSASDSNYEFSFLSMRSSAKSPPSR